MNLNRVEVDGKKGKLIFHGNCLDPELSCEAICCRLDWVITISLAEYQSGLYEAEQMCSLTKKSCDDTVANCIYQIFQLKKNAEGACVHLGVDSRCRIYENRPKVCRDFTCKSGWKLGMVFPAVNESKTVATKLEKETFIGQLTDDMTFVSHPLIKLHTVFNVKAKGEIIFVKEMVGKCGKLYSRDGFQHPQLDDDLLLRLIHLFESKDTLQEIRQRFSNQHAVGLTKIEFYELVWLLNKHKIILEASNFRGMLEGMGGI